MKIDQVLSKSEPYCVDCVSKNVLFTCIFCFEIFLFKPTFMFILANIVDQDQIISKLTNQALHCLQGFCYVTFVSWVLKWTILLFIS